MELFSIRIQRTFQLVSTHLPSYEKVGVMEIVLVQHSVPA